MPHYLSSLATALLLLLPLSVGAAPSTAPDHRYTVKGFVLDAQENPRSDVKVVAIADNGLSGQRVTDRRGFYRISLHLHNEDLGRILRVNTGDQEARIKVAFDPGDTTTNREHDLNFIGTRISESDLGFRGLPTWSYVGAGLILLAFAAARIERLYKRRRRRMARQEQKASHPARGRARRRSRAR
jgi:hypothetical protein